LVEIGLTDLSKYGSTGTPGVNRLVEYQLYFISTVFLSLPTLKKSEKNKAQGYVVR
jgi:hypothetical protein